MDIQSLLLKQCFQNDDENIKQREERRGFAGKKGDLLTNLKRVGKTAFFWIQ